MCACACTFQPPPPPPPPTHARSKDGMFLQRRVQSFSSKKWNIWYPGSKQMFRNLQVVNLVARRIAIVSTPQISRVFLHLPRMHFELLTTVSPVWKCTCRYETKNKIKLTCGDRRQNLFVNPAHFLQIEDMLPERDKAAILDFERTKTGACAQNGIKWHRGRVLGRSGGYGRGYVRTIVSGGLLV